MLKKIAFRVDAHPQIGLGHVIRCLTLAKEFKKKQSKIDLLFITGNFQPGIDMIKEHGYPLIIENSLSLKSPHNLASIICPHKPDLVIMDINDTNLGDMNKIKQLGCFLVTIDDLSPGQDAADTVIDANRCSSTQDPLRYLFGPEYIILKDEFRQIRLNNSISVVQEIPVTSMLISFGGSDPSGLTQKTITALQSLKGIKKIIVLGRGFLDKEQIKARITLNNDFELKENLQDISQLMKGVDLALISPGLTMYELACLGVPSITLCTNEEQNRVANLAQKRGITYNLGLGNEAGEDKIIDKVKEYMVNYKLREAMSIKGRQVVDGLGTIRVVKKILELMT